MQQEPDSEGQGGGKAWLWMAACCVPMIAVIMLVVLGYWNFN